MSRIGNKHIDIPSGVTATVNGNVITVKGPKGELTYAFNHEITVKVAEGKIEVTRPSDDKQHRSLHGTTRANIHNMVVGVVKDLKKYWKLSV